MAKEEQKKGKPGKGEKHVEEPKAGLEAPRHSAKERPRLRTRFEKEVTVALAKELDLSLIHI